ncbi:N-acetylmuramoyl-L-alanine amidase [Bradyrhizobium sp. SSBR45G]|uniref:N-acetylmuramoyl-L-alanine amidase n=1 Tax=unclassified Bradyrhizobium TaxID=2631580 RepID=UPI002342AA89|nr:MULTISPECIES: N-acetylmuramoyl-L-alanine amidase [unclassified Bradyrhizobium]GLH75243.1 N-acetylmuramoyl-L-alanine amidase [Bradyrhizobium sp. SSBR45G]GLH82970.1 N-acetylmuramoyl-L-alanine amidase [Bradyrhizobium sp. SSBR45R]
MGPAYGQSGPIGQVPPAAVGPGFPIASDARLAGDSRQTRFVLDLDKTVPFRAFLLNEPYRVVVDLPQVSFHLPTGAGTSGRGLVKAFRYGLVMPGGSRIVFDLTGPARIANSTVLDAANGQPPRLVIELEEVDEATFARSVGIDSRLQSRPAESAPAITPAVAAQGGVVPPAVRPPPTTVAVSTPPTGGPPDTRPVIVIDPGHGGVDYGTQGGEVPEKNIVLAFGQSLRDRLERSGKYRVIMTRDDDTFIPLGDRVRIAQKQSAALFVSIHADALPKGEGSAQGATIYTLADKASDVEAERLAEAENRADQIGGVNLTEEPADVADILFDLARRETRTFSNRFARLLMNDMKTSVHMHKRPLKSAGFRVLKAPDVPSVLVELGYVSNKGDMGNLVSDAWRSRTADAMARAIDAFLAKRVANAGGERADKPAAPRAKP